MLGVDKVIESPKPSLDQIMSGCSLVIICPIIIAKIPTSDKKTRFGPAQLTNVGLGRHMYCQVGLGWIWGYVLKSVGP